MNIKEQLERVSATEENKNALAIPRPDSFVVLCKKETRE